MKKIAFLVLLGFLCTGCNSTVLSNIPPEFAFNPKKHNSLIIGKVVFEGIEAGFGDVLLVLLNEENEKIQPFHFNENKVTGSEDRKTTKTEYYFFLEIPPGTYAIHDLIASHKIFEMLETHLLNARLTVPADSILYIGTVRVKGLSRPMRMIGPVTESEIVDERSDVINVFKERYPQFKDREVKVKVIDRYEFFRDGGLGGEIY